MTSDGGGLTRRRFADRLDRLGPRLETWPVADRSAADELLAVDAEARAMLAASGSVDTALHGLMANAPAALPLLRTGNRTVARAVPVRAPSWPRLAGFGMAALAASLAIGFVVGTTLPSTSSDDPTDGTYLAVNDTDSGDVL